VRVDDNSVWKTSSRNGCKFSLLPVLFMWKLDLAIGSAYEFFLSVLRQAIWFLIYCSMYFRINDHENVSKSI